MKKIFILLLLALPLALCGQSKARQGLIVGDVSNVVIDSVDQTGDVIIFYTSGAPVNVYNDSVQLIPTLQDSIRTMWATLYGVDEVADVTAPSLVSGAVESLTPDLVTLYFNENLDSSQTATVKAALAYSDGASVTIDSVGMDEFGHLYLYTDTVYSDSTLTLTYTQPGSGGIQDSTGNRTASFTDFAITNNIVDSVLMDDVHYVFENSVIDQAGNHNGVVEVALTYESSSPDPAEGVYSAYFGPSADDQILYVPATYDQSDRWTISFWMWYNGTTPNYIITNIQDDFNDGFNITMDEPNHEMVFAVEDGGWTYASTGNGVVTENGWTHVAVSCITSTGTVTIYIDGSDQTDDSSVSSDFDLVGDDGRIRIGYTLYGNIDDFRIIGDTISDAEAAWLYNNPGEAFYRLSSGSVDPPPSDPTTFTSYADSILAEDFEDSPLGTYTLEDWNNDFGSAGQFQNGLVPPYRCEIVSFEGGRVFKVTNPANTLGANAGFQRNVDLTQYGLGDEIYMSVNIYFMSGFDAVWGGKLPIGFAGGSYPDLSVEYNTLLYDGYWYLVMFRNNPDRSLDYYIRYPGMTGIYANHLGRWQQDGSTFQFTGGQWYNLTIRMVLNDVYTESGANGILEGFIDGVLAFSRTGLRLRMNSSVGIDATVFSYFFGGSQDYWENDEDTWIYWDDIYIFNYRSDYDVVKGNNPSSAGRVLTLPDPDNKW